MTKIEKLLLLSIIGIAIFFRFFLITQMPGGLFPDEAANGLDINRIANGSRQVFFEANNGREGLFFYLLYASVSVFGRGPWQHHIVSATIGVLTVLASFLAARGLFQNFGFAASQNTRQHSRKAVQIGLMTAFILAVTPWHITLSRTAFRAILMPLCASLAVWAAMRAVGAYRSGNWQKLTVWSALTGVWMALGMYTYIPFRITIFLAIIAIAVPLLAQLSKTHFKELPKRFLLAIAAGCVGFGLVVLPLVNYFIEHPAAFVGRSGQVSIFNPDLNQGKPIQLLAEVTVKSLWAYIGAGDVNWRHNVSGFPFIVPLVAPFFILGFILVHLRAVRYLFQPNMRKNDWHFFFLAGWFWSFLLGVITSAEGIPHGLRAIGTIPSVIIFSAYGLYVAGQFLHMILAAQAERNNLLESTVHPRHKRLGGFIVIAFSLALILYAGITYFWITWNSSASAFSFRSDLTAVSNYLNGFDNQKLALPGDLAYENGIRTRHTPENTYLVLDGFSEMTVEYLTTVAPRKPDSTFNTPYTRIEPGQALRTFAFPNNSEVVFTQSSMDQIPVFLERYLNAQLVPEQKLIDRFGTPIMEVWRLPGADTPVD